MVVCRCGIPSAGRSATVFGVNILACRVCDGAGFSIESAVALKVQAAACRRKGLSLEGVGRQSALLCSSLCRPQKGFGVGSF